MNQYAPGVIGLVVVDYLQLMKAPGNILDRRLQVEHVSQDLKRMAIQYEVPVLCLSSLTRPPSDASAKWRPAMNNLRESGELEHDGDIVLLAHRDVGSRDFELNVAKNRDGQTGLIHLDFDYERLLFTEGKATT